MHGFVQIQKFYLDLFIYLSRPHVCSVYYELIDSKFVKMFRCFGL